MKGPLALAAFAAALVLAPSSARAADPWVDRRIVLSGSPVGGSIDLGMGFGHNEDVGRPYLPSANGVGFNAEAVLGIVRRVDIGVRVGMRFGDESAVAQADAYGRLYDSNTYYPFVQGTEIVADPEIRVRGKLLDVGIFELGLEGRAWLPVYPTTVFATSFGVPMAVHAGHLLKIDFGGYLLISAQEPRNGRTWFAFDAPANFWFQVSHKVWLGPMTGFRFYGDRYFGGTPFDFILGFGLGVSVTRWLDVKMQVLFPRINEGTQYVGAGVGVGFVFE